MKNKEIMNKIILENNNRQDKSFLSIKEFEYVKDFESNFMNVLEGLRLNIVKNLTKENLNKFS